MPQPATTPHRPPKTHHRTPPPTPSIPPATHAHRKCLPTWPEVVFVSSILRHVRRPSGRANPHNLTAPVDRLRACAGRRRPCTRSLQSQGNDVEAHLPARALSLNPPTGLVGWRMGPWWPLGWCVYAGRRVLGVRTGVWGWRVGGAWGACLAAPGAVGCCSDEQGQAADVVPGRW